MTPEVLAAVLARIPYVAHLGVRAELHGDEMTAVLPYSEHLIGNPMLPALHGGVIGGFMELTAAIQLSLQSGDGAPKPIDVTVEYLRSGRPRDTFARAEVKKVGRRIANVQVETWQEARAKPIAALRGHFLLAART
ncbi:MAG: PaaI family thioesterase [Proteobacteria bacterium]|nr:PaaI family thioesterase [Pseudomonadota bacterium]